MSIRVVRRGLWPLLLLCMILLRVGASAYAQEKDGSGRITQEELRHAIMRFSGSSSDRIGETYVKLEERFRTPKARLAGIENSAAYISSALDIAIGPDPEANLLDMVVLVTLVRMVVEEYWVPRVFGDEAKILVEVFRRQEAEIWSIAAKVLTPQEQQELRDLIRRWRERNPDQIFVEATRFGHFAAILGKSELAKAQAGGGFLGVKGVTRTVSEARLLGERAMFYAQRWPWIVRLSARLMLLDVVQAPEIKQVMIDTNTLAKSMHQLATLTEKLPELISEQRTATIADVSKMLEQVAGQIEKERTAAINQVLEAVAAERKAIFPQVIEVSDHAFHRAAVLIVIFLVGSLLAGLIYRFLSVRLIGSGQASGG